MHMKANIAICSREISLIFPTLFTLRYNFVAQMVKELGHDHLDWRSTDM
jgi:hypothetical protein